MYLLKFERPKTRPKPTQEVDSWKGVCPYFKENLARWNIIPFGQEFRRATPFHTPKKLPNSGICRNFRNTSSACAWFTFEVGGCFCLPWRSRGTWGLRLELRKLPGRNGVSTSGPAENPSEVFVEFPDFILNMMFFSIFSWRNPGWTIVIHVYRI